MSPRGCGCEDMVLAAALDAPRTPASDDVTSHLDACESCRELFTVAAALRCDGAEALAAARVPSAGQAWWRAELRSRQEAAVVASRPITVATGLAVASLIGVLASLTGVLAWWWQDALALPAAVLAVASSVTAVSWAVPTGVRLAVWLVAGVLLVATPLVLYLAVREE